MLIADAFSSPHPSWNVVTTFNELLQYPYMQNAFIASALVAAMTATVGWFMVLRMQAYAGHTLSVVGFPGAAGAVLLGAPPLAGFFVGCTLAAIVIAASVPNAGESNGQSAAIGTVQACAMGLGLFFVSRFHGFLNSATSFLFGSFVGVSRDDVALLSGVSAIIVALMIAIGRPLLFASTDPVVAAARGVPVQLLSVAFLIVLAFAVAGTSQFTGALLVFALLVAPPAAAQQLSLRPITSIAMAGLLAVGIAWFGLATAYFTNYPVGFLIATNAFVVYCVARMARVAIDRRGNI